MRYSLRSHGDTPWWMGWAEEAKVTLLTCVCHLGGEGWKVVLRWSYWPLQNGGLKALRLLTWQLKTPRESAPRNRQRGPPVSKGLGWEIVPLYSAGQNISRVPPGS